MLINPYALAAAAVGDPSFANVSLLMHLDSNLIDSSSNNLSLSGTTFYATTGQKFGSACADLANVAGGTSGGSVLSYSIGSGSPLDLGSGDFTVEGWFYQRNTINSVLFSTSYLGHYFIGANAGAIIGSVEGVNVPSNSAWTANGWHHVALVMQSDAFTFYVDGVSLGTAQTVTRSAYSGQSFYIGGTQFGGSWPGLADDFRVTKGVARYTSNFSPPTAAFPNS